MKKENLKLRNEILKKKVYLQHSKAKHAGRLDTTWETFLFRSVSCEKVGKMKISNESGNFLIGALKILRGMHPGYKIRVHSTRFEVENSVDTPRWPEPRWTELRGKNLFHRDIYVALYERIENCHNFSPTGWNRLIFIIQRFGNFDRNATKK